MNKELTISIAAYNVENFIRNTLDSLIVNNMEKLEVLIIDDGSKDKTAMIAKEYAKKYPNTFKVISKENCGYGSTINCGIKNATGKYFKQLDGDDWFDTKNLEIILNKLEKINSDAIYTPYITAYEGTAKKEVCYEINDKINEDINTFLECKFKVSMHNLMYKTSLLKENKIRIDENCFYTDTEYVVYPLFHTKTITSISLPLYIYRFGLEGQSISYTGRIKHYKDHLKASSNLLKYITKSSNLKSQKINYLNEYVAEMLATSIGGFLIILKPSKEIFQTIKDFDENVKKQNTKIYKSMIKYSSSVNYLRNANYFKYLILYYFKMIKRKAKIK